MRHGTFHKKSGIYIITCLVTGDIYIGSAVYLRGRHQHHLRRLQLQEHRNRHLQNAWNKYGDANFSFTALLYCDIPSLIFFEQRAIDTYLVAYGRERLYNLDLVAGSPLGRQVSAETRRKQGISRRGKPHTEECKQKMSRDRRGRKHTDQARENMRIAQLKRHARLPVSDIQKRRTSQSLMGHSVSPETREKIRLTKALKKALRVNTQE